MEPTCLNVPKGCLQMGFAVLSNHEFFSDKNPVEASPLNCSNA